MLALHARPCQVYPGGDTWTAGNWSIATHLHLSWGLQGLQVRMQRTGQFSHCLLSSGTTVARTTVPGGDNGDLLSHGLMPEQ